MYICKYIYTIESPGVDLIGIGEFQTPKPQLSSGFQWLNATSDKPTTAPPMKRVSVATFIRSLAQIRFIQGCRN